MKHYPMAPLTYQSLDRSTSRCGRATDRRDLDTRAFHCAECAKLLRGDLKRVSGALDAIPADNPRSRHIEVAFQRVADRARRALEAFKGAA